MSRPGPKRGRDNVYEVVKGQYCEPTDEERLSLKTPQASCVHCNQGQTKNTSEMHWHLCVCIPFGNKEPALQAMLRTCVPDSILRSHKKKALYQSWQAAAGPTVGMDDAQDEPKRSGSSSKKAKFLDTRSVCEDVNKLVAKWAYMYRIPSSAIDSQEFRDIILALNSDIYKFPDKQSLSGPLLDAVYQQTYSQVNEHFAKAEGLHMRFPAAETGPGINSQSHSGSSNSVSEQAHAVVEVYDGRGTLFYRPVPTAASRRSGASFTHRALECASSLAELRNSNVVSVVHAAEQDYSEEQRTQVANMAQACESVYPRKIVIHTAPFSALACAELMLSNITAVQQVVSHAQCVLQYLEPPSAPGTILRSIIASVGNDRTLGVNFYERLKLPEDNTIQSVSAMLDTVTTAHQAGVFHRLLNDGVYQNYCRSLADHSAAQASLSVQSILVSDVAMAGIEQAALALQLFLTAAAKEARPYCTSYSDALATRDALLGAVDKAARLTPPWRAMINSVIASRWEQSYHAIAALACKVDPRRRFTDLPGTMEADAQRMRDMLIAHLESAQRKAVIDSWVRMVKREDCFGELYALESAHLQNPLDWWIAHAAAHRELREYIAFPLLSALGVNLSGNNTPASYDPAHGGRTNDAGAGAGLERDAADAVQKMELNEDILRGGDLLEKVAFVRRNCWSLHHARKEVRLSSKRQFALMCPADLLPSEFPAVDATDSGAGLGSSSAEVPYAMQEYNGYAHEGLLRTASSSASLPSNHAFGDPDHDHAVASYMIHHGETGVHQQQHQQQQPQQHGGETGDSSSRGREHY